MVFLKNSSKRISRLTQGLPPHTDPLCFLYYLTTVNYQLFAYSRDYLALSVVIPVQALIQPFLRQRNADKVQNAISDIKSLNSQLSSINYQLSTIH